MTKRCDWCAKIMRNWRVQEQKIMCEKCFDAQIMAAVDRVQIDTITHRVAKALGRTYHRKRSLFRKLHRAFEK